MRDDTAARLALLARTYVGPTGRAPRHQPFRRAALSFMRWQVHRGLLNPLGASPPGSVWWRAINERLLRDGCEAVALIGGLAGEPSSQAVRLWLEFIARPTARTWYRAHNASIVGACLEHKQLAGAESAPERFFMNVALARVLYAHALVRAPRLALGWFAPLARLLGDPRLGVAGAFLSLGRVLPNRYPLERDVESYIADEQRLGHMLDYAVIVPRLQRLYEWSAQELGEDACSTWYATPTRSPRGRLRRDTSGARRTCRSRAEYSNVSHGLAEGATGTGYLGLITTRQLLPSHASRPERSSNN